MGVAIIVVAALVVASLSADALVLLGGLAVAYGLQMWPALIGVCWWPWLTRQGVTWGLVGGFRCNAYRVPGPKVWSSLGPLAAHDSFCGLGHLC